MGTATALQRAAKLCQVIRQLNEQFTRAVPAQIEEANEALADALELAAAHQA